MCTGRWYCRTLSFWLSLFSTSFPVDTVCVGGCVCPLQRLTHGVATKYTHYFAAREFSITPLLPPLPPSLINRLRFLWTLGPMKTKQKTKTKPLEDRQSLQGELAHQRKKELSHCAPTRHGETQIIRKNEALSSPVFFFLSFFK